VHELPALPAGAWAVPCLLAALLALRHGAARAGVWCLLGAAWTVWCASERLAERLPVDVIGRDFAVTGFIATFPSPAPGQTTFTFSVTEARAVDVPRRLRLTWYEPPRGLAAGDAFRMTVRLRPPHGGRNPGGFDYERWLLVADIGATGYVRSAEPAPPSAALGARWLRYRAAIERRLVEQAGDDDGAALLIALALGERHRFSEEHWSDFRRTGTAHLVAVSGMHVALLGLVVFVALRWLSLRLPEPLCHRDLEAAALASFAATAYYAALTGFAVPAQRSLVMIGVALAALVARRPIGIVQGLSATLWIVIAWDPFAPLAAAFWLSFGAVAVLLAIGSARMLPGAEPFWRRPLVASRTFVALQCSVALALVPLTAWHFGEISLVGPLANLVAIPWFNFALMPFAVLGALLSSFDSLAAAAAPLVHATSALASLTAAALHWLATWPSAALALPRPSWPIALVAVGGVATGLLLPPVRGRWLAWLAMLPMFAPRTAHPERGEARAVVLDVGHGLAVIVETRSHRLLFDAGPTFASGFDSGEDVVLPALFAGGRRGLDMLVVSHADRDHSGGAAVVMARFPGLSVLGGPDVVLPGARRCRAGQAWDWDGVRFEILHPPNGFVAQGNDASCVLRVGAAGGTLLLTGDIERRGETALLSHPIAAHVVVVPHHGSATSSSPSFVAAVGAEHAVVSAGFENRWGFPRPEVRRRWVERGADVVVTGDRGAVEIALGRQGVAVDAERDRRHYYWEAVSLERR